MFNDYLILSINFARLFKGPQIYILLLGSIFIIKDSFFKVV